MASINLIKSLKLYKEKIWSFDFSQGILATGSTDRKIKLVSVKDDDFTLIDVLDETAHKKAIRSVAWRPHTSLLAAGSFDSTVSIWAKEESADRTFEMDLLAIIEGHENEVKGVAWSNDGYYLATCSRDKSVWIWETDESGEEYECISVLQEHSQDVKHVIWHPSEALLASSSYDDTVRIWKDYDDDWECVAVLNGHEGTVWSADFDKTEGVFRLCSGSDDSTVRVWKYMGDDEDDQQEWVCEAILPDVHKRQVYNVAWGFNGLIASVGADGVLAVYEEVDGEWKVFAKRALCHGVYEINVVKWLELNGKTILATGGDDGIVNFWSLEKAA
ncbi:CDA_G0011130.mRNA.1.CDS.1 [Saccharomyces cerevisiae]|nr:CCT_1a_G0011250.mRNA.1.CDS.1 [Saccharomyces cerevisiae]CAI4361449.1 CDA_G0011130.mRNA.1.CDS.1 [Saccharomyces cerevisiae]CAI7211863.1 CDA_G0011130.mRNA.1.CDS.1 [Saccharomyces cerevisiae]CAI7212331.1 CCT_1a_G0011250.mRNA.1.CDS.1 [Saccharomyces cerevisiae]